MDVNSLPLNCTFCLVHGESRKRVLEIISTAASKAIDKTDNSSEEIFEALLERERLGSTAVGHGIAIPHCRYTGLQQPIGILITLKKPIPFDAPDNQPVDIFFAVIAPEDANEQHLDLLANLTKAFRQTDFRNYLREATTDKQLHSLFVKEFTQ